MARTRGNLHSTAQDAAQRSRKKKKVARGEDSGYSSAGTFSIHVKECFSVGAEVGPHKSNHPYRVIGIEMYELGNWAGVAYHVGTKSKEKCIEHYSSAYVETNFKRIRSKMRLAMLQKEYTLGLFPPLQFSSR
ncbi:hypothetical protein H0E87_008441 [Populus deltoides]|uniref:SANT domain-containing protein n=1 Tax=Populus deltoides TaxID=3696 RepID=A0A8T2Z0M5_POPDE|nr:hypothetical protein H0E87_008441 [Populus deltoides]